MTVTNSKGSTPEAINTGILFVDLENSVQLSEVMSPKQYNTIIDSFQHCMSNTVEMLKKEKFVGGDFFPIGDYAIAGDQLVIFFFEPTDVETNTKLTEGSDFLPKEEIRSLEENLEHTQSKILLGLLLAAINLKSDWLIQDHNLVRIQQGKEPIEICIGIHIGKALYTMRYDGESRVEGFDINFAKRVETFSRKGRYSRIMISEATYKHVCNATIGEWNLSERFFFKQHVAVPGELKGIQSSCKLYELMYRHAGLKPLEKNIKSAYTQLFSMNPTNLWAYYLLFDDLFHTPLDEERDLSEAFLLSQTANRHNPGEEKILHDLARCVDCSGNPEMAEALAMRALDINPDFILVHQFLGGLYSRLEKPTKRIASLKKAISLCFGSPGSNMRLGLALCEKGDLKAGEIHMNAAKQAHPGYLEVDSLIATLIKMEKAGCLPESWKKHLPKAK